MSERISLFGANGVLREKIAKFCEVTEQYECEVAVIANDVSLERELFADKVVFVDGVQISGAKILCEEAVGCSMCGGSCVTLTGIGEDKCLMAVDRCITDLNGKEIRRGETLESYDERLTPEENMLVLVLRKLLGV